MSDNLLLLIPTQPEYVPNSHARQEARKLLQSLVVETCEVTACVAEQIGFVDAGANFESVSCPVCRSSIAREWWSAAMGEAHISQFSNLEVLTPCCQTRLSLNNLDYNWPQGFARFILKATNPGIPNLERQAVDELERILGCKLRVIWAHL